MDGWMDRRMDGCMDGHTNGCTDVRMDGQMDRHTDGHISSTGPHWGPLDPSVGINTFMDLDITPLDIFHSNISIKRPVIGKISLLKPLPSLAMDIILDYLALFVPGSTNFLQHFLGSKNVAKKTKI